ncbi:MAG: transcriptional repressor [Tenericutes bacterium]|nr:transcriptional repressor [Mycoplasmatota bacterium]
MQKENFIDKILNAGLKNTKYRLSIIELLSESKELLTAYNIREELLKKKIKINLSTVYRTVDKLVETKILNRINLENEKNAMYEYNREKHHHFLICENCNKIVPIYSCPIDKYELELEEKSGFQIKGHKIEFYGICEDCQKA